MAQNRLTVFYRIDDKDIAAVEQRMLSEVKAWRMIDERNKALSQMQQRLEEQSNATAELKTQLKQEQEALEKERLAVKRSAERTAELEKIIVELRQKDKSSGGSGDIFKKTSFSAFVSDKPALCTELEETAAGLLSCIWENEKINDSVKEKNDELLLRLKRIKLLSTGSLKNLEHVIAPGMHHVTAVNSLGTAWAVGKRTMLKEIFGNADNIVSVFAAGDVSIGVDQEGKVHAEGIGGDGNLCDKLNRWRNIASIAVTDGSVFGLTIDGTVITTNVLSNVSRGVHDWRAVSDISAGNRHILGLKKNGRVLSAGSGEACAVTQWRDICMVSAGKFHSAGLRTDGSVVFAGMTYAAAAVTNIVSIASGDGFTVGLRSDGKVALFGNYPKSLSAALSWTNIAAVYACEGYIAGLKTDGSVVLAGNVPPEVKPLVTWSLFG